MLKQLVKHKLIPQLTHTGHLEVRDIFQRNTCKKSEEAKKLIKIPAFSRTLFTSIITARNVLQGLSDSRHVIRFWIVGEKR